MFHRGFAGRVGDLFPASGQYPPDSIPAPQTAVWSRATTSLVRKMDFRTTKCCLFRIENGRPSVAIKLVNGIRILETGSYFAVTPSY